MLSRLSTWNFLNRHFWLSGWSWSTKYLNFLFSIVVTETVLKQPVSMRCAITKDLQSQLLNQSAARCLVGTLQLHGLQWEVTKRMKKHFSFPFQARSSIRQRIKRTTKLVTRPSILSYLVSPTICGLKLIVTYRRTLTELQSTYTHFKKIFLEKSWINRKMRSLPSKSKNSMSIMSKLSLILDPHLKMKRCHKLLLMPLNSNFKWS